MPTITVRCRMAARPFLPLAGLTHFSICPVPPPKRPTIGIGDEARAMALDVKSVENLLGTPVPYAYAVKAGPWLFLTGVYGAQHDRARLLHQLSVPLGTGKLMGPRSR